MTNLIKFDGFDSSNIRVTDDGRYSVLDVIRFCTGSKNPSQFWNGDKSERSTRQKGLVERFPEVIRKTDNFKFSGQGQRETPVADREGILYIIGLLPGAVGRSYREASAKVFLAYLDASPELAGDIIDRATPEDLKKIEARLRGKQIRVHFTQVLQDHGVTEGWQFGACTNAIYRPLLGADAATLKKQRGLSKSDSLRDSMSLREIAATMFAETESQARIEAKDCQGFKSCHTEITSVSKEVKELMDRGGSDR